MNMYEVKAYDPGPDGKEIVKYYTISETEAGAVRETMRFDFSDNQEWAIPPNHYVGVKKMAWVTTHAGYAYEDRAGVPSEQDMLDLVIGLETERLVTSDEEWESMTLAARNQFHNQQVWLRDLVVAETQRRKEFWAAPRPDPRQHDKRIGL